MKNRILKTAVSMLLTASMLCSGISAFAANSFAKQSESVVPVDVVCENGSYDNGVVTINSGKAEMRIHFTFASSGMNIKYKAEKDVEVKFDINPIKYSLTETFAANETLKTITFPAAVTDEWQNVTLTVSAPITILGWDLLPDYDSHYYGSKAAYSDMVYTDFEDALQTASVIVPGEHIAVIRNAKRYYSTDDLNMKAEIFDGTTYVPTEIMREMLRDLVEEHPENNTVIVKSDDIGTFVFDETGCTVTKPGSEKRDNIPLKIINGTYYLPVRYIFEAFGKAVDYVNGMIVADEEHRIKEVTGNPAVLAYVAEIVKTQQIEGRELHVAQKHLNASDSNDGSENAPYKTINAATAIAKAGDKVIVHEGKYRETVTFANSGVAGSPIILEGAKGEEVTIDATEEVTQLKEYKDGMYIGSVPNAMEWYGNQLWINREVYAEGRHPNKSNNPNVPDVSQYIDDLCPLWPTAGYLIGTDAKPYWLEDRSGEILNQEEKDYWKGATVHMLQHEGWRSTTSIVEESEYGWLRHSNNNGVLGGMSYGYFGGSKMNLDGDFAFITNHINTVDMPGEWFIDDKILYIIPPEGFDINKDVIEYKARTQIIDIRKKSHIKISNIKGFGGAISGLDAQMCIISDCDFKWTSHMIQAGDTRSGYVGGIKDKANEEGLHTKGMAGHYISGSDNVYKNNTLFGSAITGLYLAGKTAYVYNNNFEQCSYMGNGTGGLYIGFEEWDGLTAYRGGHSIYYNSVSGCGRSALIMNNGDDWINNQQYGTRFAAHDIGYNDFFDSGIYCGRDGGIFYGHASQNGNEHIRTRLHNNVFWDYYVYDAYEVGIYYDAGVTDMDSYNNVVFCTNEQGNVNLTDYIINSNTLAFTKVKNYGWSQGTTLYVPGGKAALEESDYPNNSVFASGSTLHELGRILPQSKGSEIIYFAEAELGDGVEVTEDYFVKPTGAGNTIKIPNVEFTEKDDSIAFIYRGNYFAQKDRIVVYIDAPNEENGKKVLAKSLSTGAARTQNLDEIVVPIGAIEYGVHDVYIQFTGIESVEYLGMVVKPMKELVTANDAADSTLIKCEEFSSQGEWGSGWKQREAPPERKSIGLKGSWGGYWVGFEGVKMYDNFNYVSITYGTKGQYSGNIVEVYVDDPDGEPVAVFENIDGEDWSEFVTQVLPIPSGASKTGIHEVYLKFAGDGKCADIYDVKFFFSAETPELRTESYELGR